MSAWKTRTPRYTRDQKQDQLPRWSMHFLLTGHTRRESIV